MTRCITIFVYIYMPIYHVYACIFVDIMYVYFIYTNEAYSDTVCWIICVHFIFRHIENIDLHIHR